MITRMPLEEKLRERTMTYLRFGWGYDMKMLIAVLVRDFYIGIWTWHFPHVYSFIPIYCLRLCFQLSALNASLFSFFLKNVHFWINFFIFSDSKVRLSLTSAFSALSYFSLAKIAKLLLQTPLFLKWILGWLVFSCCPSC